MNEIEMLLEDYFKWLKDKTITRNINDTWMEITTPYLDSHNDYLQIYARRDGDIITLTDDSYTLTDLYSCGCPPDTPRKKKILKSTLNGFGIQLENERLFVKTTVENFPQKKHDLIQAMLAISDLLYISAPQSQGLFFDDVVSWFDAQEIRYISDVRFIGKSGFDNKFDFGIPKSTKAAERLVQTMTNPSKEAATNLFFKWIDTKTQRPANSKLIALVNNSDKKLSSPLLQALHNYDIEPILWTERNQKLDLLAS